MKHTSDTVRAAKTDENKVDSVWERAQRHQCHRVREHHVQRVSRVVRHAENAPDELEHRRVEQGDEPWRERPHVHHQRRGAGGDGTRHVESGGEYTSTGYRR
jgi:hypothetical protein